MKNKKATINPLIPIIPIIMFLIISTIALVILNQTKDKACAKLGYDTYYKIGGKIGICERDNGDFINVKMVCENDKTYKILLGLDFKCKAIKVKESK